MKRRERNHVYIYTVATRTGKDDKGRATWSEPLFVEGCNLVEVQGKLKLEDLDDVRYITKEVKR